MSEAHKPDDHGHKADKTHIQEAAPAVPGAVKISEAVRHDMEHLTEHARGKMLKTFGWLSVGEVSEIRANALNIAVAKEKLKTANTETELRMAQEDLSFHEERMHALEHDGTTREWVPDKARVARFVDQNRTLSAAGAGVVGYGAVEAASLFSGVSTGGTVFGQALGYLGDGSIVAISGGAGAILGRLAGGYLGPKLGYTAEGGKKVGQLLGAGGAVLGTCLALPGGAVVVATSAGFYAAGKYIMRAIRRGRAVEEEEPSDEMKAISKEQKAVADLYDYDLTTSGKVKGRTTKYKDLVKKLEAVKPDEENKPREAARETYNALEMNIMKLAKPEKPKEASEARLAIQSGFLKLEDQVTLAEQAEKKNETKDIKACKKAIAKGWSLKDEYDGLRALIGSLSANARVKAAAERASATINTTLDIQRTIVTMDSLDAGADEIETTTMKADEAERRMNEAIDAMNKLHDAIGKSEDTKHQVEAENRKFAHEATLEGKKVEVVSAEYDAKKEIAQIEAGSRKAVQGLMNTGKMNELSVKERYRQNEERQAMNRKKQELAQAADAALRLSLNRPEYEAADQMRLALGDIHNLRTRAATAGGPVSIDNDAIRSALQVVRLGTATFGLNEETRSLAALAKTVTDIADKGPLRRIFRGRSEDFDAAVAACGAATDSFLGSRYDAVKEPLMAYMALAPDADRTEIQALVSSLTPTAVINTTRVENVSSILKRGMDEVAYPLAA